MAKEPTKTKRPGTSRGKRRRDPLSESCDLPLPPPVDVLTKVVLKRSDREAREIQRYVEWQAPDGKVQHLEKVTSERVLGRKFDVWDVQTDKERWWVITNPTNLYRQKDYASMDYTLSFHIGVTSRVLAQHEPPVGEEHQQRLAAAWRRWKQAADALDKAEEAEEFQAVGMRCRECLLEFVRAAGSAGLVPAGHEPPARGDFIHWTELIANAVAAGERNAAVRAHLKGIAKSTWQLVAWLTHAQNANRLDAMLALHATESVLVEFGIAVTRLQLGTPDRCPSCSSYQMASEFRPDLGPEPSHVTICTSCGWSDAPDATVH